MGNKEIEEVVLGQKEFLKLEKMHKVKNRIFALKNLYSNIKEMQPEIVEALKKDFFL